MLEQGLDLRLEFGAVPVRNEASELMNEVGRPPC